MEDQNIREGNEETISGANTKGDSEAIALGGSCVHTRQFHHSHELTVGVCNDSSSAVGQLLEQNRVWREEAYSPQRHSYSNLGDATVGENCGMAQWITDGHIAVNGHGQEEARLHGSEAVDEEHLGKARIKGDVMISHPEETEHAWQCRCGEDQVSD